MHCLGQTRSIISKLSMAGSRKGRLWYLLLQTMNFEALARDTWTQIDQVLLCFLSLCSQLVSQLYILTVFSVQVAFTACFTTQFTIAVDTPIQSIPGPVGDLAVFQRQLGLGTRLLQPVHRQTDRQTHKHITVYLACACVPRHNENTQ